MKKSVTWLALWITISSCLFVSPRGFAADTSSTATSTSSLKPNKQTPWHWLREADKEVLLKAIPAVPLPGSDQDKADLQAVLKAQAARTPKDIEEAKADEKFTMDLVTNVVGPDFTPKNYPVTFDLLKRLLDDESFLTSTLKEEYKRNRPYQDHPEVKNLFPAKQYSYPSGHASGSRILMLILAQLFPDKATALINRANTIAQSRVNAGVHYPSDIIAGNAVAHALEFAIQDNPEFQNDLAKAKAEISRKK
jgi:acid phosphatase (class A)